MKNRSNGSFNLDYKPIILRLNKEDDLIKFNYLKEEANIHIIDQIDLQLVDLVKCQNPSLRLSEAEIISQIKVLFGNQKRENIGVWVYYSWAHHLVHLLDEVDFVAVRTNRNQLKITKEEQSILMTKTIGVIGLSVGNSIALTMAQERICGCLRLADFDTLELSNLNRIRAGVHQLGMSKSIITARQIAEIDPFLKVELFENGLDNSNLDEFIKGTNLIVEVCDDLQIKVDVRLKAKSYQIPLVMDTNDRGMLDIERFDIELDRPIFHGVIEKYAKDGSYIITDGNRVEILSSIIDFNSLSDKMKFSMNEIGKSISNWPQLASSVTLGGAITTEITREILLNRHSHSGRFYIDLGAHFGF